MQKPLIAAVALLVLIPGTYLVITQVLGLHGYNDPPEVGEHIDAVIERLGPPAFDSREEGALEAELREYQLGYTDGMGTRHHLTVRNGVIVEIEYSSR